MSDHDDLADENAALRADNARLRRLLDEAGLHDGLRHGLRDTLVMLRMIMRRSAETAEDVEGYAAHLEGRLDAIARTRVAADTFGEVDLHALIADALLAHVVQEGERAYLDGPTVRLRPKTAQVMALALHELASNAIEHGTLGAGHGRLDATWAVDAPEGGHAHGEAAPTVALVWKESGGSGVGGPARRGFGTTVLEETLVYDLGARVALAYEADGLRYTVRFPLAPRVGRLAREDEAADHEAS